MKLSINGRFRTAVQAAFFGGLAVAASASQAQDVVAPAPIVAPEPAPAPTPAFVEPTIPVAALPVTEAPAPKTEASVKLEKVQVTGSRIKTAESSTAQPVISLSRKDIEKTGYTQLSDVLRALSVSAPSVTNTAALSSSGESEIDLRNLGSQRTLVLVNGRRWVNGVGRSGINDAVDLTTIPLAIVDRVEVLKDGAAAVYGSDAIAGVVNVITKKQFDGIQLDAQYGQFSQVDGADQSYSATVGTVGERSSVYANLSYTTVDPILESDRKLTQTSTFGFPNVNRYGASSTLPTGRYFVDGQTGSRTLIDGRQGTTADDFRAFNARTDGASTQQFSYLQTPRQVVSFFSGLNYKLLDNVALTGEFLYNNRRSSQNIAPTPLVIGPAVAAGSAGEIVVAQDNIYNPFGEAIGDTGTEGLQRRLVEGGPRRFFQDINTFHIGLGLEGDFNFLARDFNWDTGFIYSRNSNQAVSTGQGNLERIARAVGSPTNCTGSESVPCVPLNLFGPTGSVTQDMLNYIYAPLTGSQEQQVRGWTANLSFPLATLPAGDMAFATGVEYRVESGSDTPDSLEVQAVSTGNNRAPTKGSYSLKEMYGELRLPVLADLPYIYRLDLTGATRYSSYEIQGNTSSVTKSKAGIELRPIQDLLLRGSYAESFRAPSINQLFGGGSDNYDFFSDPCSTDRFAELDSTQQARCTSQGVTAGGYVQANPQIRISSGAGNSSVKPEEAKSLLYGFVYSPSYVPGFTTTVDFYKYDITNNITTLGGETITNGCILNGNQEYCDQLTRNPGGSIKTLKDAFVNQGSLTTSGIDARFDYLLPSLFDNRFGRYTVTLDATYLTKYNVDTDDGQGTVEKDAGRGSGTGAFPRWKGAVDLGWKLSDFTANYRVRYIDGMQEDCGKLQLRTPEREQVGCFMDVNPLGVAQYQHNIGPMVYNDVQFGYNLRAYKLQITSGVRNIFDRNPPVSYSSSAVGGFAPFTYDIPGVSYYAKLKYSFK